MVDLERPFVEGVSISIVSGGLQADEVTSYALIEWCSEQDCAPRIGRGRCSTFRIFWRWASEQTELHDILVCLSKIRQAKGIADPTPEDAYAQAIAGAVERTRFNKRGRVWPSKW